VTSEVAIFGNSRAVHSVYAPELSNEDCYDSFHFGYNGLSILAIEKLIFDYLDRNKSPGVVVLEISALYAVISGDKQLSIYGTQSTRINDYLKENWAAAIWGSEIFHLLRYNSA